MASPRPTFAVPTLIKEAAATRYTWGDQQSGCVEDVIHASSHGIHQLLFTLSPGAWFRHSPEQRTIFGADETYHVLDGVLLLSNPETGEVHRVAAGETAFFRKDTWHHGLCEGPGPVRVLEYMSPPPAQGASQAYARTRPYLAIEHARYHDDGVLGRWPADQAQVRARHTMRVLRAADVLWRLEGPDGGAIVGIVASTEHLTAGILRLRRRASTGPRRHAGDVCLYVRHGVVGVEGPAGTTLGQAIAGDAVFVPAGATYQLNAAAADVAELLFGVGGSYLAGVTGGDRP